MPDIFELYNQQQENTAVQEAPPQEENLDQLQEEKGLSLQGDATGDPQQDQANRNQAYSDHQLGAISSINTEETYEDPNSWSPEYSTRGFMEEAGTSIMRGIGNHIIKGTGDMLQVVGGLFDKDLIEGNIISRALQNAGTGMADKFQSYIPEDLQGQNITWSSMMEPRFWSTQVAEMIPQLAEFIFLSKGGSALAKQGTKKLLKDAPGATKTALGKEIIGTGTGITGKLATDVGLTNLGNQIAGAVGGGVAGNLFSGLLNAAEVVNSNKDLTDPEGNPLYTEEELQQMAAGTLRHNAAYVLMDMASWGMTYGGGWKQLKNLNPVAKGGKLWNSAERSKIMGKMFAYDVAPIFKSLGRVAKKGLAEGVEEMYQESWEEWAKMKAESEVTGKEMEYDNYFDFFKSKENEATKVLSFAVGALGGSAFNVRSLINQKADDSYRMFDRSKNLSEVINKQGTDQELEWQEYHIRQTIADIVIDDKINAYEDFSNGLVERGNITEDEKAVYDEMLQSFQDVKQKGEKLNVKGLQALLYNNAIETHAAQKIAEFEAIAQENIKEIEQNEALTENEKAKKISEIETGFKNQPE